MKILITTFMLFGLLFSPDMKEDNLECFACQEGTSDYCTGYADGLEANGENPNNWAGNYNKCVKKRGCNELVIYDPNQG